MTGTKTPPSTNRPASPHADRSATESTVQPTADGPPTGEGNTDPSTNSGYPAGGSQSPRGKDPFGRKDKQEG